MKINISAYNQAQGLDKMLCSVGRTAWQRSNAETMTYLRASLSNHGKLKNQKVLNCLKHFTSSSVCRNEGTSSDTVKDSNENQSETIPIKSSHSSEDILNFHDRQDFLKKYPAHTTSVPRQAWIESLEHETPDGMVVLHPDVWGIRPRIDILWDNIDWQKRYKTVLYNDVKDRHDLHEGPRPWPRKGGGKARHRSQQSPIWTQGGKAHGPRGPRTDFFMCQYTKRVAGLIHTLSAKFAQGNIYTLYCNRRSIFNNPSIL